MTGPVARSCGTCGACCKVYEISELFEKPAGVWCTHWQRGCGCDIYEDRPQVCRSYRCSWIKGQGDEKDRPDKVRVVMDSIEPFIEGARDNVLRMSEVGTGGLKGAYAVRMTAFFLKNDFFVLHMDLRGRKRMHIPRTRPVPQDVLDNLVLAGCEVVHG